MIIDIPNVLRLAADSLDNSLKRVEAQREANKTAAADPAEVMDALITLGQAGVAAAQELSKKLPKPGAGCGCNKSESSEQLLDSVLSDEMDRLVARLGLVQEDELAALRKRVVELEKISKEKVSPAKPAKKVTKKVTTSRTKK